MSNGGGSGGGCRAPSWCRQSSKDDSYLVVHREAARHIPHQGSNYCRRSSKDDSYLVVHREAARHISHQETASPRRKGALMAQDLPNHVIWIQYHRETASEDGDLVDTVVMAVSPVA